MLCWDVRILFFSNFSDYTNGSFFEFKLLKIANIFVFDFK